MFYNLNSTIYCYKMCFVSVYVFYYRVTHYFGGSIYVSPLLTDFPLRNPDFSPKKILFGGRGVTSPSGRVGRRKEQELLEQKVPKKKH